MRSCIDLLRGRKRSLRVDKHFGSVLLTTRAPAEPHILKCAQPALRRSFSPHSLPRRRRVLEPSYILHHSRTSTHY